jgi:PD-(D/E)XK nuclease superfamily
MSENTSFSTEIPHLQLVIDQTSLGLFKECPRKYYYRMIEGWVTRQLSVHLSFGSWFHEACEEYEWAKVDGADHQEALRAAVRYALTVTWDKVLNKPWNSENREKNRYSLVRSVVNYLDAFGENSGFQTLILANGDPAIELTFKFTPWDSETGDELTALTGEPIYFAGHLDRIVLMEDTALISDRKTTSRRLGPTYFNNYSPDNQFSMYTYTGKWAFQTNVMGVICDAVQVLQSTTKFERQLIYRTEGQLREWYRDAKFWIGLMGRMAEQGRWPQNDKACFNCPFRPVCARDPGARQGWLETAYTKEIWDPSRPRNKPRRNPPCPTSPNIHPAVSLSSS